GDDIEVPRRHVAAIARRELQRYPDLGVVGKAKAGRHDAHDLVALAFERQWPADGGGVAAEACAPEAVRQDRAFLSRERLFRHEIPTLGWQPLHVVEERRHDGL